MGRKGQPIWINCWQQNLCANDGITRPIPETRVWDKFFPCGSNYEDDVWRHINAARPHDSNPIHWVADWLRSSRLRYTQGSADIYNIYVQPISKAVGWWIFEVVASENLVVTVSYYEAGIECELAEYGGWNRGYRRFVSRRGIISWSEVKEKGVEAVILIDWMEKWWRQWIPRNTRSNLEQLLVP